MDIKTEEKKHKMLYTFLKNHDIEPQTVPHILKAFNSEGESYSIAYPIQGLLKYHGMSDENNRIAYFPSISLNNDSVFTVTYIKLSNSIQSDCFILNGKKLAPLSREFQRILFQIDTIRTLTEITSNCILISQNVTKYKHQPAKGKGLGTSASGGAAIAHAIMNIIYKNQQDLRENISLRSIFSRFLAGSASRSSVGGIGLWLNYPGMDSLNSIAVRLDNEKDEEFMNSIDLITVSLESTIKTEQAHKIAPNSPFFEVWANQRYDNIKKFIQALKTHDLNLIGLMAEYDTLQLHAVTMTADIDENLIVWSPETLAIIQKIRDLRKNFEIPAYFSVDTGPSVVILTDKQYTQRIIQEIKTINPDFDIIIGKIAGPSKIIESTSIEANLLSEDISIYNVN